MCARTLSLDVFLFESSIVLIEICFYHVVLVELLVCRFPLPYRYRFTTCRTKSPSLLTRGIYLSILSHPFNLRSTPVSREILWNAFKFFFAHVLNFSNLAW